MFYKLFEWSLSFLPKMCQCGKVKMVTAKKVRGRPRKDT